MGLIKKIRDFLIPHINPSSIELVDKSKGVYLKGNLAANFTYKYNLERFGRVKPQEATIYYTINQGAPHSLCEHLYYKCDRLIECPICSSDSKAHCVFEPLLHYSESEFLILGFDIYIHIEVNENVGLGKMIYIKQFTDASRLRAYIGEKTLRSFSWSSFYP